ncbi:MAG: oligoribonuclease [Deltaproteobacteria bacterium]|nr:oligoribonuclease [Deltaproteobacteria bacterium]
MKKSILAWLDLEMTGLCPENCVIVQLAMILTDTELKEIASPLEINIWQPESILAEMSPFVRNMHEKSGLLAAVRNSQVSVADAEKKALELLSKHAQFRTARLCGNSIWQDRRFLVNHMPLLEGYLHYRQIDVSSIKELAGFWLGTKYEKPEDGKHTALHDVRQSIAELNFYRQQVFVKPSL